MQVGIMHKTIWFYEYECNVVRPPYGGGWYGSVAVPSWHPVRSVGLVARTTLLLGGEWVVFTDGGKTRAQAVNEVWDIAFALRRMQSNWDSLSPYEREYLVR